MKTLALLLVLLSNSALATDLSSKAFFKDLVGKWEAAGTLKGDQNNEVKLTATWEGKGGDEGFIMEGQRTLNESKQSYRWIIKPTSTDGQFEVQHITDGKEGEAIRFEANLSEVNHTLELRATSGATGSIVIKESFTDETKQRLQSEVTFTGDAGNVTLSGTVINTRVKP